MTTAGQVPSSFWPRAEDGGTATGSATAEFVPDSTAPAVRDEARGMRVFMKVSAKAEYACLAILALARQRAGDPPVRIREISESHGIPERYLVQILLQLKGAGLVASTRGAAGGYRLARSPASISLGEVLSAIDGPDTPPRESLKLANQVLASVWEDVRAAERAVLDKTTIAQLAERTSPREWVI